VISPCDRCGGLAETRLVAYRETVGIGILRMESCTEGAFCSACEHETFWHATLVTLFAGWWGLMSLVAAPLVILQNVRRFLAGSRAAPPKSRPALVGGWLGRNWRVGAMGLIVGVGVWRAVRYALGARVDFGPQVDWLLFAWPALLVALAEGSRPRRDLGWLLLAVALLLMAFSGRSLHITIWACLVFWLGVGLLAELLQARRRPWTQADAHSLVWAAWLIWLLLVYAYFQLGETVRFVWMYLDERP